ncbi:MAG: HD domain-containing protein [Verrucomicrobiota bacterium]|nr:HD domain-containing protein [Verrucomicrobiota bacterium]
MSTMEPKEGEVSGASGADGAGRVIAAIDIGSSAIRLDIGEVGAQGDVRILESLRHGVQLGRDVFTKGRIQQDTLRRSISVLKNYDRLLKEYGVTRPDQIRAVATSFAREAPNRDMFVDRISTATGMMVRVLEESEEARLTYLAVRDILEANGLLNAKNVAVMEIGGGQTILLYIRNGKVMVAQAFRSGALRTHEQLEASGREGPQARKILKAYAAELIDQMRQSVPSERFTAFVVMGAGARFAAEQAVDAVRGGDRRVTTVATPRMVELAERVAITATDQLAKTHHMTHQDAATVAPAIMTMAHAARAFKVKELHIVRATLRDGLLREMAMRDYRSEGFEEQVLYSARNMAVKFDVDENHSRNVESAAAALFDVLQSDHMLKSHDRLLLRCAAMLHDVGMFLSNRAHHKHSMYLIQNSDLFGLTRHDMRIVAIVSRYHRKAVPNPSHPEFALLPLEDRMTVVKQAALLRVADALSRTHRDVPPELEFRREANRFVILMHGVDDLTMERLVLRERGNLFADVFGMVPELREARALPSERNAMG